MFDQIGEKIVGSAEFYREHGHWHVLLRAPNWVLKDMAQDLCSKGDVFTVANRGSGSMLIVAASWKARKAADPELEDV